LVFGLGIFGSAGMGVDYRDNPALFDGYSNLQLMKFAPTIAFNNSNWGIGFAPVIQYGALDINYRTYNPADGSVASNQGNGMSTDLGYGFNLGGYFDISENLTIGLAYQSAIDMEYKDQITNAACGFGVGPTGCNENPRQSNTIKTDNLEQPSELKVGVAYTAGRMMYTADYKQIGWGSAKGYKDFNWEDQNVFGLGAKFTNNTYWVGVGYNYGSDPIKKLPENTTAAAGGFPNQAVNLFNNHFFPGIVESHFTFGGGMQLSKSIALDAAVVMASEIDKTVNTGAISGAFGEEANPGAINTPASATTHTVKHSQLGYTIALRMNF